MGILTQSLRQIARLDRFGRIAWLRRIGQGCASLFGQDCFLCGGTSQQQIVCAACSADFPRLPPEQCPQCALPSPQGARCGACLAQPPHYDQTRAVFAYDFPIDKLVQSFKYAHRLALSDYFGRQMLALTQTWTADRIIPLPLHRLRLRERGFNQALELARPLSAARAWPIDSESCLRIRHTPAQAHLPWRARAKNIRGAFQCTRDLSGQQIILLDDVMTTGASLNECARILKLHGAQCVNVLVLARALPRSR